MAYATLTELLQRLDEQSVILLTDDALAVAVDTDAVDRAFADADTEIDSYIATRYAVPMSPVPALVQRLSLDLAIEGLYTRRPHVATPEAVTRSAKNARLLLANIAANKASIPGVAELDTSGTEAAGASFEAGERLFTRTTLRGM